MPDPQAAPSPSLENAVLGVAIFDVNGLPREYFVTPENPGISWVQTVFQALGLKSLLTSSLQLDSFQHIVVHAQHQSAVVIRQRHRYIALLIHAEKAPKDISPVFVHWVKQFESTTLRNSQRFRGA